MKYYIASCKFTLQYPELSRKIRNYVTSRGDLSVVRCCVPGWKTKIYEDKMPAGEYADEWRELSQSAEFAPEDEIWSVCPNCMNVLEEWKEVKSVHSLWELINEDENFEFPDYSGLKVTIQDCWRMRDRSAAHSAVRELLTKMNVDYEEIPMNRERADFCGSSLYREQSKRNPQLAPRHYIDGADGLFLPHSKEEQISIMRGYCAKYRTKTVVAYCHYCLEGLIEGGMDGRHIAEMLFPEKRGNYPAR